jgi:hypothetical protein
MSEEAPRALEEIDLFCGCSQEVGVVRSLSTISSLVRLTKPDPVSRLLRCSTCFLVRSHSYLCCRRLLFHGSSKATLGGVQRRVNLDCRQLVANLCISTSCFAKTIGLEPGDGRPPKDGGVRFKRATLPDYPSEEACRHFVEVRASVPSTYPVLRAMFGVATSCLRTWSSCNRSSPNSPAERSSQATLGRRR